MWNFQKICRFSTTLVLLLIGTLSFVTQSRADFPDRPINLIVPFGPGGITDLLARSISKVAEKQLGQPIVIENKEGGGGSVGLGVVAKARPDGYTIGAPIVSILTIMPQMREVVYKLDDFAPILGYTIPTLGICVKSDAPWKTYEELINYAKQNPGTISYGTSGPGTLNHLAMEWLGRKNNIKWTHIPFKGGIAAITNLMGGHVNVVHASSEFVPFVESGKIRLLLVTTGRRLEKFPNVPEIREKEGGWYVKSVLGLVAPKGVPNSVLQKLEGVFKKATEDRSFIQACESIGVPALYISGEQCHKLYRESFDECTVLLKELGLYKSK